MSGHVFVRIFSADHRCCEDGIGWSQTSGDSERREEVEARDERIYEGAGHEPALEREKSDIHVQIKRS